jgi:hypothetical protein
MRLVPWKAGRLRHAAVGAMAQNVYLFAAANGLAM